MPTIRYNHAIMKRYLTPQVLLFGIVCVGLVLRLHGLVWTLPYYFFGDETRIFLNGVTVYQNGVQDYSSNLTEMANYPPIRSWEVATLMSALSIGGNLPPNSVIILFGRLLSLSYALLTIGFLYQLAKRVTHNTTIGLLAAAFFAVYPSTILFGQRILADGAGLMFFVACAWLSVMAYQQLSYKYLVYAVIVGVLAGLGKYNYFTALLFPALTGLYFLLQRPTQIIILVILPSIIGVAILYALFLQTVSTDNLFYNYLNETAQLEGDLRNLQMRGFTPDDPEWKAQYERYPLNRVIRLEANFFTLREFLPPLALPLMILGMGITFITYRRHNYDLVAIFMIVAVSFGTFFGFSYFRMVEGRQLFGAIFLWGIFWAIALVELSRFSKPAIAPFAIGLVVVMAGQSWTQNIDYTKTDVRVATVNWFLENTSDGTGIAMEDEPYEFWGQNGFNHEKTFRTITTYRLFEKEPQTWENEGYYYLVADSGYEWRGGYYAGHPLEDVWNEPIEIVARFEGDDYVGDDRMVIRVFTPQTLVNTDFGNLLTFYGYDIESQPIQAGELLDLKYYWQAEIPNHIDYVMFNHVVNTETGEVIVLFDRMIGNNLLSPSSTWVPKQWTFDTVSLEIPTDTPSGTYAVRLGVYDPATGQRLPVTENPNGFLTLFEFTLSESTLE